jgi:hypothetical protein
MSALHGEKTSAPTKLVAFATSYRGKHLNAFVMVPVNPDGSVTIPNSIVQDIYNKLEVRPGTTVSHP